MVKITKYNWPKSDGSFKKMVALEDNQIWAAKCNKCLTQLSPPTGTSSELDENADDEELQAKELLNTSVRPRSEKGGIQCYNDQQRNSSVKKSAC